MLLDFLFERQPARHAVEIKSTEVLMFNRVRDSYNLSIGLIKQVADIDLALPSAAHDGNVHFLAGSYEFGSAQNMPRHESHAGRCNRSRGQEFATAQ